MKTFKQIFGNELKWVKGLTPVGMLTLCAIFRQALCLVEYVEEGHFLDFLTTLITLILLMLFANSIKISKNEIEE